MIVSMVKPAWILAVCKTIGISSSVVCGSGITVLRSYEHSFTVRGFVKVLYKLHLSWHVVAIWCDFKVMLSDLCDSNVKSDPIRLLHLDLNYVSFIFFDRWTLNTCWKTQHHTIVIYLRPFFSVFHSAYGNAMCVFDRVVTWYRCSHSKLFSGVWTLPRPVVQKLAPDVLIARLQIIWESWKTGWCPWILSNVIFGCSMVVTQLTHDLFAATNLSSRNDTLEGTVWSIVNLLTAKTAKTAMPPLPKVFGNFC